MPRRRNSRGEKAILAEKHTPSLMHCRRADDRLAQSCPGPSNEVLPGKQKSIAIDPMLKLARYICPQHHHFISNPRPMFFWKRVVDIIFTGVTSPMGSKIRPKFRSTASYFRCSSSFGQS